jgi:protein-S-isoprenylcysteine O-methyltransferase Ste14
MTSEEAAHQVVQMTTPIKAARVSRRDIGRIIMVPVAAVVLTHDIMSLAKLGALARPADGALRWAGTALTCLFYALIILCYFRRSSAIATHGAISGWAVAVIATMAPFPLPFFHSAPPGAARQLAADLLLLAGTAGAIWSLWYLGKNLSVIAQARAVADRGPYRVVRHPLYTAEMISALGLALAAGTAASYAAWVVLGAMQVYRATCEEQVLLRALPAYLDYRAGTPALIPAGQRWSRARRSRLAVPVAQPALEVGRDDALVVQASRLVGGKPDDGRAHHGGIQEFPALGHRVRQHPGGGRAAGQQHVDGDTGAAQVGGHDPGQRLAASP